MNCSAEVLMMRLNSTAKKLEDRQNLNVVNRMIFSDSLQWENGTEDFEFHFETLPAPPPVPDSLKHLRGRFKLSGNKRPKQNDKNVEVRVEKQLMDAGNKIHFLSDSLKRIRKNGFAYHFQNPGSSDSLITFRDTLILNADSFFSVSMVKIDSMLSRIDSTVIVAPELFETCKTKGRKFKTGCQSGFY
jgi:two-component system, OmpR family, phosphate regulon sensor histidine kinase PhoR